MRAIKNPRRFCLFLWTKFSLTETDESFIYFLCLIPKVALFQSLSQCERLSHTSHLPSECLTQFTHFSTLYFVSIFSALRPRLFVLVKLGGRKERRRTKKTSWESERSKTNIQNRRVQNRSVENRRKKNWTEKRTRIKQNLAVGECEIDCMHATLTIHLFKMKNESFHTFTFPLSTQKLRSGFEHERERITKIQCPMGQNNQVREWTKDEREKVN